jgi:hypothetical protein
MLNKKESFEVKIGSAGYLAQTFLKRISPRILNKNNFCFGLETILIKEAKGRNLMVSSLKKW